VTITKVPIVWTFRLLQTRNARGLHASHQAIVDAATGCRRSAVTLEKERRRERSVLHVAEWVFDCFAGCLGGIVFK
jgi:hypothetical protein